MLKPFFRIRYALFPLQHIFSFNKKMVLVGFVKVIGVQSQLYVSSDTDLVCDYKFRGSPPYMRIYNLSYLNTYQIRIIMKRKIVFLFFSFANLLINLIILFPKNDLITYSYLLKKIRLI